MPFKKLSELPDYVRKFDQKIQDAWMKTFNSAWESWPPKKKRKGGAKTREEYAYAVANSGLPAREWLEAAVEQALMEVLSRRRTPQ